MKVLNCFKTDESGAVTVDWVVMTSAVVGISIAVIVLISGGVREASNNILVGLNIGWNNSSDGNAESYFDFGIAAYPDDQREAWLSARLEVDTDAPSGYNYDPNFTTTRYIDDSSGNPIYISDDGATYSIGGEIISVADYEASDSTSFKNTFDEYWDQSQ
ncbi:hypothetical protein A9Q96_03000 [Rhodobacterales bacterium 52_120_T64]|nr:hypothetical protein A9Q96_03000 [Rhodobacterales bacterium 52_120_T64]